MLGNIIPIIVALFYLSLCLFFAGFPIVFCLVGVFWIGGFLWVFLFRWLIFWGVVVFFFPTLLCHILLFSSLANLLLVESQEAPVIKLSAGLPLLHVGSGFPPLRDAQLPSLYLPEEHG